MLSSGRSRHFLATSKARWSSRLSPPARLHRISLRPDLVGQLGTDQHADAVAQQGREVATVLGLHEPRAGLPRDLGDVRIIDPAARRSLSYRGDKEVFLQLRRKVVDREAREDLLPQEPQGDLRFEAVFFRQARRHRVELEATVPSGHWALDATGRDGIQQ